MIIGPKLKNDQWLCAYVERNMTFGIDFDGYTWLISDDNDYEVTTREQLTHEERVEQFGSDYND